MTAPNGILGTTGPADDPSAVYTLGATPPDITGLNVPPPDLATLNVTDLGTGQFNINGLVYQTIWQDDLQAGPGHFSRQWGDVTWSPGMLSLKSSPDFHTDAGAMVPPTGADDGYGYGLTSFAIRTTPGDVPGPYALLWPSTDQWPGPEMDVMEILRSGQAYSTVHWKGGEGGNAFDSHVLPGVDASGGAPHVYGIDWEGPGNVLGVAPYIDIYVDGYRLLHITENVPADFAHGGENGAPGVGMQTWWSIDAQHAPVNEIQLLGASYLAPVAAGVTPEASGHFDPGIPNVDSSGNLPAGFAAPDHVDLSGYSDPLAGLAVTSPETTYSPF